jgi:hypothetical protein
MVSRRGAELAWSAISDLGRNPHGLKSSRIMEFGLTT